MNNEAVLAKGQVERIGLPMGAISQKSDKGPISIEAPVPDHNRRHGILWSSA